MERPDVEAIKERAEKATSGHHATLMYPKDYDFHAGGDVRVVFSNPSTQHQGLMDTEFLNHVRRDQRDLIAYIEELEAKLKAGEIPW